MAVRMLRIALESAHTYRIASGGSLKEFARKDGEGFAAPGLLDSRAGNHSSSPLYLVSLKFELVQCRFRSFSDRNSILYPITCHSLPMDQGSRTLTIMRKRCDDYE